MILLAATKFMFCFFKNLRYVLVLLIYMGLTMPALAADFMKNARLFIETSGATPAQNQDYIAQLNQFTAEGEFTAVELAEIFLIRALIFSRLNDDDNALESYAAALNTSNLPPILQAEAYKNRGLLYYNGTAYSGAKDDFERALEILSGNAELHYYLANAYFGLYDFESAIIQYDLALEGMANNRFLAYYGKGSVYFQQKLFEKSRENLNKSLEVKSDFEPSLTLLAEIDSFSMPPAPSSTSPQNVANDELAITNDNGQLTPNEIYNQLLEQAFEAKKTSSGNKKVNIKLKLTQDQIDNIATSSIPRSEKKLKIARSDVNLRDNLQTFEQQISETPFVITEPAQPKRLDALLAPAPSSDKMPEKGLHGYFLQLASSSNRKNSQTYYQQIIKKHQTLLAGRPYVIREFKDAKQQMKYQLLISGFQSYKQANSLCKFLKAQNSDCFVRQIK